MAENSSLGGLLQNGQRIPESVRAQIMAAQLMQQSAAQNMGPYTSSGVNALRGISGLLGGLMEGSSIRNEAAAQAAHRTALATLLAQPQGSSSIGIPGAPQPGQPISSPGATPAGYDPNSTEAMIRSSAAAHGIDPNVAVAVARSEGMHSYTGDNGSSFGPFQLHYGNVASGGNAVGGLGDTFTKQTGLDARDPSTVPQQIDFAMQNAAQNGWGAWHGAKNSGIGNFQGIGQAPKTAAADMPAPNATPTGSTSLPPGITPDMVSGPAIEPSLPPAAKVTAAMAAAGMDTTGLPGAAAPQPAPSPFGALRPMSQPPAPAPAAPAPSSPFGGPPQPMGQQPISPQQSAVMAAMLAAPPPSMAPSAPQPDPNAAPSPNASAPSDPSDTSASPQVAMSSGADPALMTPKPPSGATPVMPDGSAGPSPLLAGQADPGAGSMLPANPPLPPQNPQSPFGGAPQPMAAPVPPSAMAQALLQGAPPVTAAPLSTDNAPGFDNFNAAGGVQQSSLGASGFTGRDNAANPITAATQGGLPVPQAYVGGDMGLGTPSAPVGPSVAASGPSAAPAAPQAQLAAALAQGAPASSSPPPAPGTGAALPQTGPLPPPRPAGIGVDPDAPAPGAVPAGPAPVPPDVMAAALRQGAPQPMGLAGHSAAADPMSAQSFNNRAMAQALTQGAPGMAAPAGGQSAPSGAGSNPLAGLPLIGGMFGGGQTSPQAPAGGQQSSPLAGLGGMFGMGGGQGQQASVAQPASSGMSTAQQQYMALLADPRTTPQEAELLLNRINPAPMKLSQGEGLVGRRSDGTYGPLYTQPALDKYKAASDGSILDTSTGRTQTDPNAFKVVEMDAGNGVKIPMRIGRNPDGSPSVTVLTPGGAGSPAGGTPQPAAPITFGGQQNAPAPGASPLTVQGPGAARVTTGLGPQADQLVANAGAIQAAQAGAKASAEANAKNDVDEVAASRTKLEGLRQSGQDIAQANAALDAYKGKMPSGPFGQNALWARGVANTVGLGDPNQLSNMEIFSKNATKVASQQIKEFTSKGTNLDLETELKNNPGLSVSDQTNRILMDHLGRTNTVQQQYEQAKQNFYDQNGSLKGFQPQWEQSISGAGAIPLSRYPVATKIINGQPVAKYLSTDPSGYSLFPAGQVN